MAETTEAVKEDQDQQNSVEQTDSKTQAQSVEFSEVTGIEGTGADGSVALLLDMSIAVTVAIGQAEVPVRRLLQLGPGSVLKLDKPIDAPADLYLRDIRFATGSVVVVDGHFAVRIKEILGLGDSAGRPSGM
jgi:flagellar motor switch protein FliN/FliY